MAAKGFLSEELLLNLKNITQANFSFVQKKCTYLGENQLIWRPYPESWNVQEILSHLNSYSAYYHHLFIEKIQHSKFKNVKEVFVSSPLGKSAWKSMKLGRANNIKRKFGATKHYNPTLNPALIDENAVDNFLKSQEEMTTILDMAKTANLKKIRIPMSISKLIRLRLGDALMFAIYHNERHIQQIKNLLNHQKFPKK